MFSDVLDEIRPSQKTVKNAKESDHLICKLEFTFMNENVGKFSTILYDKRDDFNFPIINLRIPLEMYHLSISHCIYVLPSFIRLAQCCSHHNAWLVAFCLEATKTCG